MNYFAPIIMKKDGLWSVLDKKNINLGNSTVFMALSEVIDVEENFSFKDLFTIILNSPDLREFIQMYSCRGFSIDDYYFDLIKPLEDENNEDKIDFLAVEKIKDHTEIPFCCFNGINSETNEKYSVSLTPLNKIKNLPIRIINNKYRDSITLLEFLNAIFFDISFHGSPKNKENFIEELNDRVMNFKQEDCIPYEDFKEYLDELKEKLKKEEDNAN